LAGNTIGKLTDVVNLLSLQDFLISVVITIFWFAGSAAWAAGLSGLKEDTDPSTYIGSSVICKNILTCHIEKEPNYATLKVSVVSLS
jgi:hypothetical protein